MLKNINILLSSADNSAFSQISEHLADSGFTISHLRDMTETTLYMMKKETDLAIIDLDGESDFAASTLYTLKKIRSSVPIITISSYPVYLRQATAAKETGAFYYIVKPVDRNVLMELIGCALQSRNRTNSVQKTVSIKS